MCSFKNAALLGLAAADSQLFAPMAAPAMQYGQLAAPMAYGAPGNAYAMSADAFAQPLEVAPAEAPNADSQFWLWAGAGALAVVGAASALRAPSAVAALDEADLESARVATLGVGGAAPKKKEEGWSLTNFLQGPRKAFDGSVNGELELLSGVGRPNSADPKQLDKRFKIGYDTRPRTAPKAKAKPKVASKPITTWRSKSSDSRLYK